MFLAPVLCAVWFRTLKTLFLLTLLEFKKKKKKTLFLLSRSLWFHQRDTWVYCGEGRWDGPPALTDPHMQLQGQRTEKEVIASDQRSCSKILQKKWYLGRIQKTRGSPGVEGERTFIPVRANCMGRGAEGKAIVGLTEHMQLTLEQLGLGALTLPPYTVENLHMTFDSPQH